MSRLVRVDLNQVPLDRHSFIGQAVAAGLAYEKLPPRFMDALQAYLRVRGMAFAQRNRTGIALGRAQLRQGMEQGLACLDLALEEVSGGDLNAAVDKLASESFDALYKRGWECACQRLDEMRQQARALVDCPELGFWPEWRPKVEALTEVVPETWTSPSDVDLRTDSFMLRELSGKVAFVRSLPSPAVDALLAKVHVDFVGVLHRVILALALGRTELAAGEADVSRFCAECFDEGGLRPHVRQQVVDQFVGHLDAAVADAEVRARIAGELDAEIGGLEQAVGRGDVAAFFVSCQYSSEDFG